MRRMKPGGRHFGAALGVSAACWIVAAGAGRAVESLEGGKAVTKPVEITVGVEAGDIRGGTNKALQAAVDYVANLGGGVVRIGPGRYTMRNALFLRDGVTVTGVPGKTVLCPCDGAESPLRLDGDCHERQVTPADPSKFQPGDGVSVHDERMAGGFGVTTATLRAMLGEDTFAISHPLYYDYMVSNKATMRLVFPVVAGYHVEDASVEGIVIEGNREHTQPLNGCRGGGIYLFECARIRLKDCTVRGYNGDGISFQLSHDVVVRDCVVEDNAGIGIHPGSGSQRPVVHGNRSASNDGDGIYVCWRVKNGIFEDNVVEQNGGVGISIGHKDTDNLFRHNRVLKNRSGGILFRDESEPMAAHRNVFEENEIMDNGADGPGTAQVTILGYTNGLTFRGNRIGHSSGKARGTGIRIGKNVTELQLDNNTFVNVELEREKR